MAYIWSGHCPCTVSVTRVVTAHDRSAQFAVLCVHSRNMGVFAGAGLVDRCGAVRTGGTELGWGAVEVWYQRGEGSVGCHTWARWGGNVAMLSRAWLWGQEWGMLGRQAGGTIGGYRQVCVLMVVRLMEGFTCRSETWVMRCRPGNV